MNEIIDAIISLLYILKYGPIINKHRNYKEKITNIKELSADEAAIYRTYVADEMRCLKSKPYSEGKPSYAIFEKSNSTMKVFILNEQLQFINRLEDYNQTTSSFYFKLNNL